MVTTSFRSAGLHHVLGAIGALGLYVLAAPGCGTDAATAAPSTLAPIMATGPKSTPSHTPPSRAAALENKCARR